MDANEFIAALSEKIDRRERLEEIIVAVYRRAHGEASRASFITQRTFGAYWKVVDLPGVIKSAYPQLSFTQGWTSAAMVHEQAWWAVREHLRCVCGVYQIPSEVLTDPAIFPWWAGVHQSKDNPELVAYTPDAATGERDARVKIAIGRLIRKFRPIISDAELAKMEAEYRSDISNDVEFITDEAALVEAYLEGPASCMSKEPKAFGLPEDQHPVQVYAGAPGVALAVLRDANGRVNARALTYVNPSDPSDKRFLRVYGDALRLERRLLRLGYVCKSFVGVKLRAIPARTETGSGTQGFLAPYLDGPGGPNHEHSYYMLTHDSRFLKIIDTAEYQHLRVNLYEKAVTPGATTHGVVRLVPGPAEVEICPLTGREYNPLRCTLRYAVRPSGEVVRAASVPEGYDRHYRAVVDGQGVIALGPSGEVPTFSLRGTVLVDNEATRLAYGFVRLDPELYPNGPTWVPKGETVEEVVDGRARRVRLADCVLWCERDSAGTWVRRRHFKTWVPPKGAVRTYRIDNTRVFVPAGTETVKLGNRQRAVPGLHDVVQLWDGTWEPAGRTIRCTIGSVDVVYKRGSSVPGITNSNWWRELARRRILSVANTMLLGRPATESVERQLDRACAYALVNTMGYTRVLVGERGSILTAPSLCEFALPFPSHVAGWKNYAALYSYDLTVSVGVYLAEVLAQWLEDRLQALSAERAVREAQTEAYTVAT